MATSTFPRIDLHLLSRVFVCGLCLLVPIGLLIVGELNSVPKKVDSAARRTMRRTQSWVMRSASLGWENGRGEVDDKLTTSRIGQLGERISSPNSEYRGKADLLFMGDSFTFGTGVKAEESFAGRVAERRPNETVLNLGVSGYSTYQSLLHLDQVFRKVERAKGVIYGFLDVTEMRNVATADWQRMLSSANTEGFVLIPEAISYYPGQLTEKAPHPLAAGFTVCRFYEILCLSSRLSFRLTDGIKKLRAKGTAKELLIRMRDLSQRHGASFSVLLLGKGLSDYENFLVQNNIPFTTVDYHPYPRLAEDPHPDMSFHEFTADRILEKLWH